MNNTPTLSQPNPIRWIALAAWVLIALAYLTFFLLDLRLDFAQLQIPCSGADCNYLAISQAEMEVLESWGWSPRTYSLILNGTTVLGVAVSWTLGGLILWRQGTSLIRWAVSLALIVIPITAISDVNNVAAHFPGLTIPMAFLSTLGYFILCLFLYLFPNGRFYPRRAFIPMILTFLAFTVYTWELGGLITIPAWALQAVILVSLALLALTGIYQVLRYRRSSTALERQQTRWILLGIMIFLMGFLVWFAILGGGLEIPSGLPRLLASVGGWITTVFAISALPITIAIAIVRYRLWDIDLLIRRTLQYSILTGLLALVYFGLVIFFQILFSSISNQQSEIFIVISTLAIAALFNPLRRRVQAFIDRRFYRKKYDAEQALARFAAVARDEVDMDKLATALIGLVEETVQPEKVSLWLRLEKNKHDR